MDKEQIHFIFNPNMLKKGDILLINTYNKRMQTRMKSSYDHVALYAGDAFIIESDGGGVVLNHLFSYGFQDLNDAVVLRSIRDSDWLREGVIFCAKCLMGMEFGSMEACRVPELEDKDVSAISNYRMFCSRLVAQSYNKMGVQLVKNPDYCTPASFLESKALFRVENALMPATGDDLGIVEIHTKARENAENVEMLIGLYQIMSKVYGEDIQTMDKLVGTALKHPEKDDEAVNAMYDTDFYRRRYEGREFFCLNNKEAFYAKYDTLDRRVWFLLNQQLHLDKTYIPSISANVMAFSVMATLYPESKVIAAFRDFFKEAENELKDYHIWADTLLLDILNNDPEGFRRVVGIVCKR